MQLKAVNSEFSVSPQIAIDELDAVAQRGFKSLMCNRPDNESQDQTDYGQIAQAAQDLGLEIEWVPVVSGNISDTDVASFAKAFSTLPKPTLAYCRTGTRSITLWAMMQGENGVAGEDILATGRAAGYDLSDVVRMLERRPK